MEQEWSGLHDLVAVFVKGPCFLAEGSEHSHYLHLCWTLQFSALGRDSVWPFSLLLGYREARQLPPM